MIRCRMCEKEFFSQKPVRGICADCREKHGLPERTEPLRPQVPCGRCGGTSFVRAYAIRERAAAGGDYVSEYVAALSLSYEMAARSTFWSVWPCPSPRAGCGSIPTSFREASVSAC